MLPNVFQANLHTGICLDRLRKRKEYLTGYLFPNSIFLRDIFFQLKIYFFPIGRQIAIQTSGLPYKDITRLFYTPLSHRHIVCWLLSLLFQTARDIATDRNASTPWTNLHICCSVSWWTFKTNASSGLKKKINMQFAVCGRLKQPIHCWRKSPSSLETCKSHSSRD